VSYKRLTCSTSVVYVCLAHNWASYLAAVVC